VALLPVEEKTMTAWIQDIRYALRQMRQKPSFAVVAILTLALGIGANTAIFSLLNSIMLKSAPVGNAKDLMVLQWFALTKPMSGYSSFGDCTEEGGGSGKSGCSFSYPMFQEIRSGADVFSGVAAFAGPATLNLTGNGAASIARGELVSGDYFKTLEVGAALGRTLEPADELPGAEPVAVLSYAYWQNAFHGEPSAVGKAIWLNNIPVVVVGVADPRFTRLTPGRAQDLWLPLTLDVRIGNWAGPVSVNANEPDNGPGWWLTIVARPKRGVTREQAQEATSLIFRNTLLHGAKPFFKDIDKPGIALVPVQHGLRGIRARFAEPLYILMAVVSIVLLITCANVAGLMLARATMREREMAVRFALGAARGRLIRQLLTESVLLSSIGGALGVVFAFWGTHSLAAFLSANWYSPLELDMRLDARVLIFTVGVAMLSGIVVGIVPAFRSSGVDVVPALKENTGVSSVFRGRFRLGDFLVVGQVALSVLVLAVASLLLRTLMNLKNIDPGFDTEQVLLVEIDPTLAGYEEARIRSLYRELQDRLAALPGVSSVSYSSDALLNGGLWSGDVQIEGPNAKSNAITQLLAVGPRFFETMQIPLLAGRGFLPSDLGSSHSVAIVNQAFARKFLAGRNAVGARISRKADGKDKDMEVVGVVADTKYYSLRSSIEPTAYFPLAGRSAYFELRTRANPAAFIPMVRQLVRDVDNNLPILDIRTQSEVVDRLLFNERLVARFSALFGVIALVLVCIGIYGLLSYEVSRRTREIGIRSALGARQHELIRLVVGQGIGVALVGVALGIAAAFGVTRYLQSALYEVRPNEPLTLVGTASLLILIAMLACYLPARRAAKVDPMVALRYE
jgi:predicted permease